MKLLLLCLVLVALPVYGDALSETRYCGIPGRDAHGALKRRADVIAAFRKAHPCPATGQTKGACPGWAIDHVIPLICGGCDAVTNMQWMPNAIKSAAGALPKDRWEQRVYCNKEAQ